MVPRKVRIMCYLFLSLSFFISAQSGNEPGKPVLAVLDFSFDGITESEMKSIITLLSSALYDTEKYTVINVEERDKLLEEITFSLSDIADATSQIRIGQLLSAQLVVTGTITQLATQIVLSVKLTDVQTSSTIGTAEGKYETLEELIADLDNTALILAGLRKKDFLTWSEIRTIKKISFTSGGILAIGGGILVLALASGYKTDTVDPAFINYDTALAGSDFNTLYAQYLSVFSKYQTAMVAGISTIVIGTGLAGYGAILIFGDMAGGDTSPGEVEVSLLSQAGQFGICATFAY